MIVLGFLLIVSIVLNLICFNILSVNQKYILDEIDKLKNK